MEEKLYAIGQLIEAAENIVLLGHKNPDGDAIGSSLGLYHFLQAKGKRVHVIVPNDYPQFLKWMPGSENVLVHANGAKEADGLIMEADLIVSLDFNDLKRIGEVGKTIEKNKDAKRILIDHHPYPAEGNDVEVSETKVSSTAELVFSLIQFLDKDALKDKDTAACIYTGIMTDTGCFSFNSSRPETFEAVSVLLASGMDKDYVFDRVFNNFSAGRMKLMGYALDKKMVVIPELRTAYISLSTKEMEEYDFKPGDTEGFVNLPLSIEGIVFAVLFTEKNDFTKISFRSKGNFPANRVASEHFNGGGHRNAAGGESKLALGDTIEHFRSVLTKYGDLLTK